MFQYSLNNENNFVVGSFPTHDESLQALKEKANTDKKAQGSNQTKSLDTTKKTDSPKNEEHINVYKKKFNNGDIKKKNFQKKSISYQDCNKLLEENIPDLFDVKKNFPNFVNRSG